MADTTGANVSTLNALYKEVYSGEGLQNLVPASSQLQKLIEFKDGVETLGSRYVLPVVLSLEQGISISNDGSSFPLNPPISMTTKDAIVNSSDHVLSSSISWSAASRAVKNGAASFENATSEVMKSAMESMSRVIEIETVYGQAATGLGLINSINSINSTTLDLTFSAGEFASGIWSGSKGLKLDALDSVTATPVNTVAAIVVSNVNFITKIVRVTGNVTDIAAIVASYGASGKVFLSWYLTYNAQFVGMNKIFNNTTGTVFDINAAQNELWQSNVYNVGGNLTLDVIGDGLATAQARGLDEDVELIVSPVTWRFLNNTATARRRLIGTEGSEKTEFGTKAIEYYTQSGVVRVWSHIYCKEGEAYSFPRSKLCYVGSRKPSMQNPGGEFEGDIFRQLDGQAGFAFNVYGNLALLGMKPAAFTIYKGITNVVTP